MIKQQFKPIYSCVEWNGIREAIQLTAIVHFISGFTHNGCEAFNYLLSPCGKVTPKTFLLIHQATNTHAHTCRQSVAQKSPAKNYSYIDCVLVVQLPEPRKKTTTNKRNDEDYGLTQSGNGGTLRGVWVYKRFDHPFLASSVGLRKNCDFLESK